SMTVRAISGSSIAGIDSVTPTPLRAGLVVTHSAEHVIVKRFGAFEVAFLSGDGLFRERFKRFVYRYKLFRPQKMRRIFSCRWISCFLLPNNPIPKFDCLPAITCSWVENTNVVSVITVLNFLPFDRDADLFSINRLKCIRLRQWQPKSRRAFNLRKLDPINEFKLVGAG